MTRIDPTIRRDPPAAKPKPARSIRPALVRETGHCQNPDCAQWRYGLHCHEITNGPNRNQALEVRAALLVLCDYCNCHEFTDKAKWPIAKQCALKLITDPEHFDLDAINKLLAPKGDPNPPQAVTLADVVECLKLR